MAGFDQKFLGRFFATTHIRANVPVQRGQGGAPLLDLKGDVVGILISSLDEGSALFALPIEAAEKVRRDVVRFGHIRPGWIGIDVGTASEETEGSFAEVRNAIPGSPAWKKPGFNQATCSCRWAKRESPRPRMCSTPLSF